MIARIFELINFLLLLGGLWWLYRRYHLGRFVNSYRDRVAEEIAVAQRLEAEAEQLQRQAQAELEQAAARAQEILENARALGERAVAEARAAAQAEAQRLLAEARREAELERVRVLNELRRLLVEELLAQAQGLIVQEMDPRRHQRIVDSFLDKLQPEELRLRLS